MTRLMLTRLLLLLIGLGMAACEFLPPTAPTPPGTTVTVDIDNRAGGGTGTGGDGGTGGEGGTGGDGGDEGEGAPAGPASITASGTNADEAVLYQIGPGQVFARTGGDAATVWCRPASDCNGEGGNRTPRNTARPPGAWIEDRHAFFRQSGMVGTTVTFTVDGVTLTHEFSTGG